VYDVTDFIDSHPGGPALVLKYGGKDATEAFEPIHASDTLQRYLSESQRLGIVEDEIPSPRKEGTSEAQSSSSNADDQPNGQHNPGKDIRTMRRRPRLSSMLSLTDFDRAAKVLLPKTSYAFLSTGAEDNFSIQRNRAAWRTVRTRPRVLRPIPEPPKTRRKILGNEFEVPFFVCPAGGAKLCHPEGDTLLTKAAYRQGALHWVCNNAGRSQEEIAAVAGPGQVLYWQIYAKADLPKTAEEVQSAIQLGYRAFALTVDAIWAGKREDDLRARTENDEKDDTDDRVHDVEGEVEDEAAFKQAPTVTRP
jgi:L-lactate dehydrogenase (cytochrome)